MNHHRTKNIISLLLVLALPGASFGITLEEAVQYALKNGEAASIVRQGAKETLETGRSVGAFSKPHLSLNGGWQEMDNNGDHGVSQDNEISGQVRLDQALFAFGKIRDSLSLEKNYSHRSRLQETAGERDIARNVKSLFSGFLHKKEELAIFQDRFGQRQKELGDAADLRDNGYATSLDVRQAMQNLNVAKGEVISAKRRLSDALTDFNTVLGIPPDQNKMVPEGKLSLAPDLGALDRELKERLVKGNLLDILSDRAAADTARLDHRIATADLLPTAALFFSGKTAGEDTGDVTESVSAGIELKWDLFSGGLGRSKKAAANARQIKARKRLSQTEKKLKAQVASLYLEKTEVEDRIKLQKKTVSLAMENYTDARGQYRAGTITLTRLGEFNLAYAEARFTLQSLFFQQRELASDMEQLLELSL